MYYFKTDRINRIVRIFFFINFRKKLMKRKSTLGGTKIFKGDLYPGVFMLLPKNDGHDIVIINKFTEDKWVYFVSSGNKV